MTYPSQFLHMDPATAITEPVKLADLEPGWYIESTGTPDRLPTEFEGPYESAVYALAERSLYPWQRVTWCGAWPLGVVDAWDAR